MLIGLGLFFTVAGLIFLEPVSRLLGADEVMLPYCVAYGRIILLALVPFMLLNVFQSFLVAAERPNFGLYITVIAGVSNMVLDALFIAVWKKRRSGRCHGDGDQSVAGRHHTVPLFSAAE